MLLFHLQPSTESKAADRTSVVPDESAQSSAITIQGFLFTGHTLLSTEELTEILHTFVGTRASIEDLRRAASLVTAAYHERGFMLSRAYLPAQEIRDGLVTIAVLEGRIGTITVEENKRYSDAFIRQFIDRPGTGEQITHRDAERGMLLLRSLFSDFDVQGNLSPGDDPRSTDLLLTVEEHSPLEASVTMNNLGSEFVSRYRFGASVGLTNALLQGDRIAGGVTIGDRPERMNVLYGSYATVLNGSGTRLSLSIQEGTFEVGREFAALGITNSETSVAMTVSQPMVRRRSGGVTAGLGIRGSNARYEFLDELSSRDRIRALTLSLSGDLVHDGGKSIGSLSLSRGLGEFLDATGSNDPLASRAGADNDFFVINGSAARLQPLGEGFSLLVRCSGQWSDDRLLAGEEFLAGGIHSVHGYASGELSGLKGWNAGIAVRLTPLKDPEILQLSFYVDHAYAWKKDSSGIGLDESLTGIGLGVASALDVGVPAELRIDLGWPLDPGSNTLDDSPIVYLDTSIRL